MAALSDSPAEIYSSPVSDSSITIEPEADLSEVNRDSVREQLVEQPSEDLLAFIPSAGSGGVVSTQSRSLGTEAARQMLERSFNGPAAQRSLGSVALRGAGSFTLRVAGGVFAGVVADAIFAESTASELQDTIPGQLYVSSGIEQARDGTAADR